MRALLPLAALALAAVAVPAHAGCVDDLVGDPANQHIVYVDDQGRIIIDPPEVPNAIQLAIFPRVAAFVDCVK